MALFFFSLLAGFVTIGGPCILPLLPIILGTSTVRAHPSRPLFIVLGFVLSFSFFAVLFSLARASLGLSPETIRWLATGIIALFGVLMVFPKLQEILFTKFQPLLARFAPKNNLQHQGLLSGFLLGTSLGLVWTPCAGPVLGSILTLVAAKQNLAQAGALLIAYALGAGLPMLAIAYGGQTAMVRVQTLTKYTATLQRSFGVIIVLVAIGIATGTDRVVQAWLVQTAPWLFLNLNLNL